MARPAICSHCGSKGDLVTGKAIYPHRPDLSALSFWQCVACNAFVGCHKTGAKVPTKKGHIVSDGTLPLGTMANAELRRLRSLVHSTFDRYWRGEACWRLHPRFKPLSVPARRKECYAWLSEALGITSEQCHIGLFTVNECTKTLALVGNLPAPNLLDWKK